MQENNEIEIHMYVHIYSYLISLIFLYLFKNKKNDRKHIIGIANISEKTI